MTVLNKFMMTMFDTPRRERQNKHILIQFTIHKRSKIHNCPVPSLIMCPEVNLSLVCNYCVLAINASLIPCKHLYLDIVLNEVLWGKQQA